MYKLPDISNESSLVKTMLNDDRSGTEIAKDFGITSKLLNERMRHQRNTFLNLDDMSKEDIVSAINQIGGSIHKQSRWFKLSETVFRNRVFVKLMDDIEFSRLYSQENYLPEDFSKEIGIDGFILRETMKRRANRLKIKRGKDFNPSMMARRFYYSDTKRLKAQKKREATMLKKYGVRVPLMSKEILERSINTVIKRYGEKTYLLSDDFKSKDYTYTKTTGKEEEEFFNYISNYLSKEHAISRNTRPEFLDGKEIDILIDGKFAIEFNGIYWHSVEQKNRGNGYHLSKFVSAMENNVILLTIWEPEWRSNKSNILNKIKKVIEPDEYEHVDINSLFIYNSENEHEYEAINKNKECVLKVHLEDGYLSLISINEKYVVDGSIKDLLSLFNASYFVSDNDFNELALNSTSGMQVVSIKTNIVEDFMNTGYSVEPSGVMTYKIN